MTLPHGAADNQRWHAPVIPTRRGRRRLDENEIKLTRRLAWLVRPLNSAYAVLEPSPEVSTDRALVEILHQTASRGTSFRTWTSDEWLESVGSTRQQFADRWCRSTNLATQAAMAALAYLLGGFDQFDHVYRLRRRAIARSVFGGHRVDAALQQVSITLHEQDYYGFSETSNRLRHDLLCLVLLHNRTPHLDELPPDAITRLMETMPLRRQQHHQLRALQSALAGLGKVAAPEPIADPRGRRRVDGIPAAWVGAVDRWFGTSTQARNSRVKARSGLFKVGRWLAERHPDLHGPEDWTRQTCASFIAALNDMRTGDYTQRQDWQHEWRGKPLSPKTKALMIAYVRRFFADFQEWEWIPRRFAPARALAVPRTLAGLIGPDPRVIADDIWAKLLWAGLNLTEDDLPAVRRGLIYPIELIRALAFTWLFAGLRTSELTRLKGGCIRWQTDDLPVHSEPGEVLARGSVCLLDVPVNKTSTAYTKPVDPLLGEAIAQWEAARPTQRRFVDRKTSELFDPLFAFRGVAVSIRYINKTIIPLLCRKAGVPGHDVRGNITSHRARSTIATQLYNAKEPMTLFELQAWLGHKSIMSTQHYAKITPTKLAKAYKDAGYFARNLRTIEVLVDREAVVSGAAAAGQPWQHYDLGHGYCTYSFFEQCPHRMACARCDFYLPKDSTKVQLLEAKNNLQRMSIEIPMSEDELAAVEDGRQALDRLLGKLADTPTPAGQTPAEMGWTSSIGPLLPIVEVNGGERR